MVEINNQRKAFLDMRRRGRGIDNDAVETKIMVMTSL